MNIVSFSILIQPSPPPPPDCTSAQLEVWPPPDKAYALRIRGYQEAQVFGAPDSAGNYNDAQSTQCDARLVFLMALANAKAHYGKPDAQVAANELTSLLGRMRAGRHGNTRYIPTPTDDVNPFLNPSMYVEPKWVK